MIFFHYQKYHFVSFYDKLQVLYTKYGTNAIRMILPFKDL